MEQDKKPPEDREVDAVLRLASVPPLPAGAMDRLLARIAEEPLAGCPQTGDADAQHGAAHPSSRREVK